MPKRAYKKYRVIASDEVQGEGSWVKLGAPAWSDFLDAWASGIDATKPMAVALKMMPNVVADWNWVDDEGNPLPLPRDDPEVIDRLTRQEQSFIVDELDLEGLEERQKN